MSDHLPSTTVCPRPADMFCVRCNEQCELCSRCGAVHHVSDLRTVGVTRSFSRPGAPLTVPDMRCQRCTPTTEGQS